MTVPPEALLDEPPRERPWLLPLKLAGIGLLVSSAAGGAIGGAVAASERGWTGPRVAVVVAFALVAIAAAAWIVRLLRRRPDTGPEARNVGTARRMMVLSGAIGGVLGMLMAVAGLSGANRPTGFEAFSNAPLPPLLAAAIIAVLALVIPISVTWHRSIDEHEAAAYRFGALLGINVYFFLSTVWWIAARGGFVPAPDGVAVFFVTIGAWGLGWAWARFR